MAIHQLNQNQNNHSIIDFDARGKNTYVISDLHLASGLNKNGNYTGTENFYADESFSRFISKVKEREAGKQSILVINGDFIDFLRVTEVPETNTEFDVWQEELSHAGINKTKDELRDSIVKKEITYGLKTNDYKTIWKLHVCKNGHLPLFKSLASWINDGNELVIITGNHDLEWYWPAIHTYFRWILFHLQHPGFTQANELFKKFEAGIHFINHAIVIDKRIHIEHGHQYERTTAVVGGPTVNDTELNLPFGSFFNRYLINRLELSYPYLDNVRPSQNLLPVLIRERFPLAIKVMFQYIPFMLLIIPKKMYWYTFKYLLNIIFIIVLPIAITVYAIYQSINTGTPANEPGGIAKFALNIAKNFGFLFLSYIFGRIMSMAGLKSPPTLSVHAKEIMQKNPSIEAVLFGHTHNPEQRMIMQDKWYFNTGTWIPIFETSSADVRMDKTFTFIYINCNEKPLCGEKLQRWNDDAERIDAMSLNDKI